MLRRIKKCVRIHIILLKNYGLIFFCLASPETYAGYVSENKLVTNFFFWTNFILLRCLTGFLKADRHGATFPRNLGVQCLPCNLCTLWLDIP